MHPAPATALALAACTALAVAPPARAQQSPPVGDEAQVLLVVTRLFDAMRTRDTATLRSLVDPAARLVTTRTMPDGQPRVTPATINDWIGSIARAPDSLVLIERTWNHEIRVDDNLATVWTPYTFHVGERFSHCGVDSFQLARSGGGWIIINVADSQRRDRCGNPPAR